MPTLLRNEAFSALSSHTPIGKNEGFVQPTEAAFENPDQYAGPPSHAANGGNDGDDVVVGATVDDVVVGATVVVGAVVVGTVHVGNRGSSTGEVVGGAVVAGGGEVVTGGAAGVLRLSIKRAGVNPVNDASAGNQPSTSTMMSTLPARL
jgi:hypothetical protein